MVPRQMKGPKGGVPKRLNVRFGSKADMCGALADVRFVPIADITKMFSCLNERSAN
jgi:hypothetical protein